MLTTRRGSGATTPELSLDPEVFLAHGEADHARGDGEGQEEADGDVIDDRFDAAEPEVRRADRRDQDDGEGRAAQQPAFDQQALERRVVERSPAVMALRVPQTCVPGGSL